MGKRRDEYREGERDEENNGGDTRMMERCNLGAGSRLIQWGVGM